MAKHTTVTVNLTTNGTEPNGQSILLKVDKEYEYMFNNTTLLYQRSEKELSITRTYNNLYVRRSVSKLNPDPNIFGGIALTSYLFGKIHMRRNSNSPKSLISNLVDYTSDQFKTDVGRYAAFSLFKNQKDSNDKACDHFYMTEMNNDKKYVAAIATKSDISKHSTHQKFKDILYPTDRVLGQNGNIVNIEVSVFYTPNQTTLKFTLAVNQLFASIIPACKLVIDPSRCNEIFVIADRNGDLVRTSLLSGVPLTQFLFGYKLKRVNPLNIKSLVQCYDIESYKLPSKPTFGKYYTSYITTDILGNQIYKFIYAETPVGVTINESDEIDSSETTIEPVDVVNQLPTLLPVDIPIETEPKTVVTVKLPNGIVMSGSVTNIATLIKLIS